MGDTTADAQQILLVTFGENIRKARTAQNLSLLELAKMTRYDRGCISNLEWGVHNIQYTTSIKLAKALDVFFPDLFSRNFTYIPSSDNISGGFTEDNYLIVFLENYKRELQTQGMTQINVCECTGYQTVVVNRILNGHTCNPTLETLAALASVTNSEMQSLFLRKL